MIVKQVHRLTECQVVTQKLVSVNYAIGSSIAIREIGLCRLITARHSHRVVEVCPQLIEIADIVYGIIPCIRDFVKRSLRQVSYLRSP